MQIDLLYFPVSSAALPSWELGRAETVSKDLKTLSSQIDNWLKTTKADFVLFWDVALGPPPSTDFLIKIIDSSIDVWHAGLKLGMRGLPSMMDFVEPVWTFNLDPAPNQEATSWRIS